MKRTIYIIGSVFSLILCLSYSMNLIAILGSIFNNEFNFTFSTVSHIVLSICMLFITVKNIVKIDIISIIFEYLYVQYAVIYLIGIYYLNNEYYSKLFSTPDEEVSNQEMQNFLITVYSSFEKSLEEILKNTFMYFNENMLLFFIIISSISFFYWLRYYLAKHIQT